MVGRFFNLLVPQFQFTNLFVLFHFSKQLKTKLFPTSAFKFAHTFHVRICLKISLET